jgi:rhodanese-related sulfurtransferase
MRTTLFEALLLIVAATVLGVAYTFITHQGLFTNPVPVTHSITPSLEMISLEQAKEFFDSHRARFIDARHEFDYQQGHIRGAVNVPLKSFSTPQAELSTAPKDSLLIVYCDGAECNSSIELSVKFIDSGFTNVKVFYGGWQEWKAANLPTEP